MQVEEGTINIQYKGKRMTITYYYWNLAGSAHINIYDKEGNEYRYARLKSSWRLIRNKNNWPMEFRKLLAIEIEKIHNKHTNET